MKHAPSSPLDPRHAFVLALAVCVIPAAVQGCSSPTAPAQPPGGGQTVALDFASFQSSVEPVLSRQGCDAAGDCHGGGIRGTLELSPPDAKDARFDFEQVRLQVSAANRDLSPILTRPLALGAGGTPHPWKPFATVADTDYVTLHAWVAAGVTR